MEYLAGVKFHKLVYHEGGMPSLNLLSSLEWPFFPQIFVNRDCIARWFILYICWNGSDWNTRIQSLSSMSPNTFFHIVYFQMSQNKWTHKRPKMCRTLGVGSSYYMNICRPDTKLFTLVSIFYVCKSYFIKRTDRCICSAGWPRWCSPGRSRKLPVCLLSWLCRW